MAILTDVRRAVWTALDLDPSLGIKTTYRYDSDEDSRAILEAVPAAVDCPALDCWPLSSLPRWYVHRIQLVPYGLGFKLFTADWELTTPEALWEAILRRLWAQRLTIKQAGGKIVQNGPVTFTRSKAGIDGAGPKMTLTEFQVIFGTGFMPFT